MKRRRHTVHNPGRPVPYWPACSDCVHTNVLGPGPHQLSVLLDLAMARINDRCEQGSDDQTTAANTTQ